MNKKLVWAVAAIAIIAAGLFMMNGQGGPGAVVDRAEPLGSEAALPAFSPESQYALLKVENVEDFRKGAEFVKSFIPLMADPDVLDDMSEMYGELGVFENADPTDTLRKMTLAVEYMETFETFLKAADEFSFLVASDDMYISFFTNEEKYASLKSEPNGFLKNAEPWTTDLAGEGAEALQIPIPKDSRIYVLKRTDAGRTHVVLTSSEEAVGRMQGAWKDPAARAGISRRLEAPNFAQYRFQVPAYTGEPRDVAAEVAWRSDEKMTRMETFGDLEAMGVTPVTSGLEAEPVPTFGSGKPLALATMDLPYIFSIALPGVDDPAGYILSMVKKTSGHEIPEQFEGDVRALLNGSRVSVGAYLKDDQLMPTTAYFLLELKDGAVIDKYLSLASMMLPPAQIEGWESAFSFPIDEQFQVTIARNGAKLLAGIGAPDEYAVKGAEPAEMSDLSKAGALVSYYVDFKPLTDESTEFGKALAEAKKQDDEVREVFDRLNLGAVDSIAAAMVSPDFSELRIYWKQDK